MKRIPAVVLGLSQWNGKMKNMQFAAVMNSTTPKAWLNGKNNVFFASSIL